MNRKIIYLTYGSMAECSVFKSQIIDLLADLHHEGIEVRLFVLLSVRNIVKRQVRQESSLLEKLLPVKNSYIYIAVHNRASVLLAAITVLAKIAGSLLRREKIVIHCRTEIPVMVAVAMKRIYRNVEIIYDIRGLTYEEYIYETEAGNQAPPDEKRLTFLRNSEIQCIAESDKYFCVSQNMKKYFMDKYNLPEGKFSVVPCCASFDKFFFDAGERLRCRQLLRIEEKIVLIYSGSLYAWQMFDKITDVFRILAAKSDRFYLLICTGDQTAGLFDAFPKDSYQVMHVHNEDMYKYYSAADFGMIFRSHSIVNTVSSPVKIAEYVACQLPVIATNSIGDMQSLLGGNSDCIILAPEETAENIAEQILTIVSQPGFQIKRLNGDQREYFNRTKYIDSYRHSYFG